MDNRPYWEYDVFMDERTPETHAALDAKVFRTTISSETSTIRPTASTAVAFKTLTAADLKE